MILYIPEKTEARKQIETILISEGFSSYVASVLHSISMEGIAWKPDTRGAWNRLFPIDVLTNQLLNLLYRDTFNAASSHCIGEFIKGGKLKVTKDPLPNLLSSCMSELEPSDCYRELVGAAAERKPTTITMAVINRGEAAITALGTCFHLIIRNVLCPIIFEYDASEVLRNIKGWQTELNRLINDFDRLDDEEED